MSDRHGNLYFTDEQQVECLFDVLRIEGFEGTRAELMERAEAWWFGDWADHRCPSLAEARAFNAQRRAGTSDLATSTGGTR
ncbi:MAG TPA: hypothetical protein VF787_03370 [Thermoanaerobaculia bacterium]